MAETELIAERRIYAVDRDGHGFELQLMIGRPYALGPDEWACPVALIGLHGVFPDMHGVDSWQALMVARELLKNLLSYFVEDGGRLYWEKGGDEITIEELFGNRQEEPVPDEPLTPEELRRVEKLTAEEIKKIDDAIMSYATGQWQKTARVVGSAMIGNRNAIENVPDIFYAQCVRLLVKAGHLESEGNLEFMRFSEVRRPS